MKNLANCKPREFLTQSVKIRRAVEKFLTDTDIMNIRKTMPDLSNITDDEHRKEAYEKQARENLGRIYDVIAEEHPDETLEVLALLCFVDPKHVDDYPMMEYLNAVSEMLSSEAVIGFFTSLMRLGQMDISRR